MDRDPQGSGEAEHSPLARGQRLLNLVAAFGATLAAAWAAFRGTPLHVAVLGWLPASAFISAFSAGRLHTPAWQAVLALTLNIAAVLVLCGYAAVAGADGSLGWAILFAAGAALAGGNVASLPGLADGPVDPSDLSEPEDESR